MKVNETKKDELTFDKPSTSNPKPNLIQFDDFGSPIDGKKQELNENQKEIIKQVKSMPLILNIESVYSGSHVDCCSLCWSKALRIKFDVVVRKTKTRTTVRLCYVCCRNTYGISNNALKEYENSTKIHALTSQRGMFEAQHLSMHRINPYKIQKDMQRDF